VSTVSDVLKALDARFPLRRAEKWDRVGLLIGDKQREARKVLVAYEVNEDVLSRLDGHDALVTYHPLIFRPLENLDFSNHTARLCAEVIRRDAALICAHTALDNAPPPLALGDALAHSLGLAEVQVLAPTGEEALCKLIVFVPPAHADEVAKAAWDAGAGRVGNYDQASFRARGQGTFRAREGASPTVGEVGQMEVVDEVRLEVLVPRDAVSGVMRAVREAHPYEEVAHDIIALHNTINPWGSCRVGVLESEMSLDEYAKIVEETLGAPSVRLVRAKQKTKRVACVPGSGASFLDAIARSGADCLVTGDFKHHDALKARALGVSVIDVTHSPTERATTRLLSQALRASASTWDVETYEEQSNPFEALARG
jgi:dinuclear metal center YbgI/SA1388 family protein